MPTNTQINIPLPGAAVVDPSGAFSKPWWYALQNLILRTGGTNGVNIIEVQTSAAQANDLSLYALMTDDDVASAAAGNITTLQAEVSALQVLTSSQGAEIALSDEPELTAAPNPFLAALMVSDTSDPVPPLAQAVFTSLAFMDEPT